MICNRRRRKGLFIDLSNEYKLTYVKRVFDERRDFIFSPENSTIASGEENTFLIITVGSALLKRGSRVKGKGSRVRVKGKGKGSRVKSEGQG